MTRRNRLVTSRRVNLLLLNDNYKQQADLNMQNKDAVKKLYA
ncbi:hypothetical protein GPAL_3560 [Glaciecola pallidula DSM 14239 = ACAM 615]|uniref:Uncharacterized protein n=1 Tax=Brumicola pallidula DSM 14239 = ACAM 615 TaxID=1121922 RepID=K6Z2I1_9ALTE|nr:hypothetical protein GPAL_3560 [Glaciecola pallidula DSM 14239 = ACAM 615]